MAIEIATCFMMRRCIILRCVARMWRPGGICGVSSTRLCCNGRVNLVSVACGFGTEADQCGEPSAAAAVKATLEPDQSDTILTDGYHQPRKVPGVNSKTHAITACECMNSYFSTTALKSCLTCPVSIFRRLTFSSRYFNHFVWLHRLL